MGEADSTVVSKHTDVTENVSKVPSVRPKRRVRRPARFRGSDDVSVPKDKPTETAAEAARPSDGYLDTSVND